jgi:hypothetical protein
MENSDSDRPTEVYISQSNSGETTTSVSSFDLSQSNTLVVDLDEEDDYHPNDSSLISSSADETISLECSSINSDATPSNGDNNSSGTFSR